MPGENKHRLCLKKLPMRSMPNIILHFLKTGRRPRLPKKVLSLAIAPSDCTSERFTAKPQAENSSCVPCNARTLPAPRRLSLFCPLRERGFGWICVLETEPGRDRSPTDDKLTPKGTSQVVDSPKQKLGMTRLLGNGREQKHPTLQLCVRASI